MREVKFLDLSAQHAAIRGELDTAIDDVLTHSSFIGGKWVEKFEEAFAEYVGAKYCIGVANGTDALEIILRGLGAEDESVVVPAFTAGPTVEAVLSAGSKPIFCDNGNDFLIDIHNANKCLPEPYTSISTLVHMYGNACNMDSMNGVIVEDCCQAHGTLYNGKHVGTLGIAGAFSFYPSKNLGAFGDAGAIVTNNGFLADFCREYANHGRTDKNTHTILGRNSRLDGLQSAILCVKLRHLDEWITHRREMADVYYEYLPDISSFDPPYTARNVTHSYHIFAILANERDKLKSYLANHGIQTMIHYPIAPVDQPAYERFAHGSYFASTLADMTLSLPMGPHLTPDDVRYVCQSIGEFYDN